MFGKRKSKTCGLSKKEIERLAFFIYSGSDSILTAAFSQLPLHVKRHCVQVSAVAGMMALCVRESDILPGMTRRECADAIRFGALYHEIGAYIVHNYRCMYPTAGEQFLQEQMRDLPIAPNVRQVVLEIVRFCCERYDGYGYPDQISGEEIPVHAAICAIANTVDELIPTKLRLFYDPLAKAQKTVTDNEGKQFSPAAVDCFTTAYMDILHLYKAWRKSPPCWKTEDIKPPCPTPDE